MWKAGVGSGAAKTAGARQLLAWASSQAVMQLWSVCGREAGWGCDTPLQAAMAGQGWAPLLCHRAEATACCVNVTGMLCLLLVMMMDGDGNEGW